MLTTDENGMPKAQMPQRWDLAIDCDGDMVPMEEGDWVKAEDMQELINQFNLLAQLASIMVPKGR
jgi:hypothetical protein